MLKKVIMTLLVFIFYLLQCTLFKTFSLGSVSPNLLLILTFCAGFMGGRKMGMYVGILSGLILDLFYGAFLSVLPADVPFCDMVCTSVLPA